MEFIKLTDNEEKIPMYVNIESICAVYTVFDGCTTVRLSCSDFYCWVSEEPEEILEMIDKALHESNKK